MVGSEATVKEADGMTLSQKLSSGVLLGLFLLIIGAPLPVDWVLTAQEVALPKLALPRVAEIKPDEYYNGAGAQKLEKRSMNESHVARWLIGRHNELAYLLLRRTAPASWLGRDRWLFIPGRVREARRQHWEHVVEYNAVAIEKVDQFVKSRGGDLVVALVPNRARVYPGQAYWNGQLPPGRAAFLPNLVAELRRRGVSVIDLTGAMTEEAERGRAVFFPDDHHWTAAGAAAAAQAIYAELPDAQRALLPRRERRARYKVRLQTRAKSEHSLVKKLGMRPGGAIEQRFYAEGSRATFRGSDARGFAGSCGTYWSTSYGRFGSPQYFANEARCPVRLLYRDGAGSGRIPVEDMRRIERARHLKGKHIFVWEIPEYHLCDGPPGAPSTLAGIYAYFEGRDPNWSGSE